MQWLPERPERLKGRTICRARFSAEEQEELHRTDRRVGSGIGCPAVIAGTGIGGRNHRHLRWTVACRGGTRSGT